MKTTKSTFDRMMENSEWKNDFEKGYEEFLISEFMCAADVELAVLAISDILTESESTSFVSDVTSEP